MELIGRTTQKLFVKAIHFWSVLFLVNCLWYVDVLWLDPVSPVLNHQLGPINWLVSLSRWLPDYFWYALPILCIALSLLSVFSRISMWRSAAIWTLYVVLVSRGWMIGTGGHQLIAILLLWAIPLSIGDRRFAGVRQFASWAVRMQLVLGYCTTSLFKLTGTDWLQGKALEILSDDPTFRFAWFADHGVLAEVLTYAALAFQITFPILIWFKPLRIGILSVGVLFHLSTGYFIEIPDMALAFIAAYAIWLPESVVKNLGQRFPRVASSL